MKTRFAHSLIVAALAAGTLSLLSPAEAGPPKGLARFRHTEGERSAAKARADHKTAPRTPRAPAPAGYPRYELIDLGTLGGPQSNNIESARNTNNRGQLIASFETAVPDPNGYFGEPNFFHSVLTKANSDIIELPFPAGIDPTTNYSFAGDINATGLMAGFVTNGLLDPLTDFLQLRPVVWERNGASVVDLGTFGGNSGQTNQTNRQGSAVGVALNETAENPDFASIMNGFFPAATQARAFLWQGNGLRDLGTLGGNDAFATAINDAGLVFGMSYTDAVPNDGTGLPTLHPFLWKNGKMRDLGSLGGTLATVGSFADGPWGDLLNQRGQAIGTSTLPGDELFHAFLWDGNRMIDLGTLGGDFSEALAINESGMVAGRADVSPDSPYHHAVLWRNGQVNDLGIVDPCQSSTAVSLDSSGETVVGGLGACTDDPNDLNYFSAFVWKEGHPMADLNDLVTPSDLHIEFAAGINDRGEIVANAFLPTGEIRAVLLVPRH